MAINYDSELSKRSDQLQLRFVFEKKEVVQPIRIVFDISTMTSSQFSFKDQMEPSKQKYLVSIFIVNQGNKKLVSKSDLIADRKYLIPEIPLPIPTKSDYDIDLTNLKDISIENHDHKEVVCGQFLWLSSDLNPDANKLNRQGILAFLKTNSQIDIPMKKKVLSRNNKRQTDSESILKVNPLGRIVFLPKTQWFKIVDSFSTFESNLFYLCIAQFSKKHSSEVLEFSSKQIKQLLNYKRHANNTVFLNRIDKAFSKFLDLKVELEFDDPQTGETVKSLQQFFTRCDVYRDSLKVKIECAPVFEQIMNEMPNYITFSLLDYARIKSNYSKIIYRNLKKWRTAGVVTYSVNEFKKILGLTDKYRTADINQKIIKNVMIDLAPYFRHLSVKKHYSRKERHTTISGWTFSWNEEKKSEKAIRNRLLDETEAIYNIKTNYWLGHDQKLKSLDKYRGQAIGTAKRLYDHAYPNTFFFAAKSDIPKSPSQFTRIKLTEVFDFSLGELASLIKIYENMNCSGILNLGDLSDLKLMEQLYVQKEVALALKTAGQKKPNFPDRSIIAGQVIKENLFFDADKGLIDPEKKVYDHLDYIKSIVNDRVDEQFGNKANYEDNRDSTEK